METITLEPALDRWLTEVAARVGRAKSDVVREALIRALEDLEDIEAADAVMARRRSGDDKTYSSAEIRRDLGLDD
jgi:RHH-type transcriptional regulator, rel operon repressor / antitoxin RelB